MTLAKTLDWARQVRPVGLSGPRDLFVCSVGEFLLGSDVLGPVLLLEDDKPHCLALCGDGEVGTCPAAAMARHQAGMSTSLISYPSRHQLPYSSFVSATLPDLRAAAMRDGHSMGMIVRDAIPVRSGHRGRPANSQDHSTCAGLLSCGGVLAGAQSSLSVNVSWRGAVPPPP